MIGNKIQVENFGLYKLSVVINTNQNLIEKNTSLFIPPSFRHRAPARKSLAESAAFQQSAF